MRSFDQRMRAYLNMGEETCPVLICLLGNFVAPLLLVTDGFASYPMAFGRVFRTPQHTGQCGAPHRLPWLHLNIIQVIKHRRGAVGMVSRLVTGTGAKSMALVQTTPGCTVANTAYIERLNGTFRERLASLVRPTRGLARQGQTLTHGMYLTRTIYNFCTCHQSLTSRDRQPRTPAMAAITDHCWTVRELLRYRVPPPRWQPPKRRGRRSKHRQALIDRCVPDDHH